jgi:hypothetical protein
MNGRRFWESRDTPDTEAPPAHDGLQSGGKRPVVAEQTPPASSTQAHAEGRVPWSQVPKRLGKPLKLDKPAAGHSEAAESRPGNSPLKAGDANPRLLSASESKPSTNASHVRKLAVKAASFNTPRISELKVFSASPPHAHTRIRICIMAWVGMTPVSAVCCFAPTGRPSCRTENSTNACQRCSLAWGWACSRTCLS